MWGEVPSSVAVRAQAWSQCGIGFGGLLGAGVQSGRFGGDAGRRWGRAQEPGPAPETRSEKVIP